MLRNLWLASRMNECCHHNFTSGAADVRSAIQLEYKYKTLQNPYVAGGAVVGMQQPVRPCGSDPMSRWHADRASGGASVSGGRGARSDQARVSFPGADDRTRRVSPAHAAAPACGDSSSTKATAQGSASDSHGGGEVVPDSWSRPSSVTVKRASECSSW